MDRRRLEQRHTKGRKFDSVYHLAAEFGRWNGEDYYENLWCSNVVGRRTSCACRSVKGFGSVFLFI